MGEVGAGVNDHPCGTCCDAACLRHVLKAAESLLATVETPMGLSESLRLVERVEFAAADVRRLHRAIRRCQYMHDGPKEERADG